MALFDVDSSHLDGRAAAERHLYDELEKDGATVLRVRAGYDRAPRQHDLQTLLTPGSARFEDGRSEKVRDLRRVLDDYFRETQYVDWTTVGFENLQQRTDERFEYEDGSTLVVEVYESGANGHAILRV